MTSASPALFTIDQQAIGHGSISVLQLQRLDIRVGEKVALLGVSGSGKSTLLEFLYKQHKNRIAYCPQKLGLVPILSVFHNIYMARLQNHSSLYNLLNLIKPQTQHINAIKIITDELGLTDKLFTSVDQLSGGQQQRTALARAFYSDADVFIGDEPVSAVDELHSDALIHSINQRYSTSIVALHSRELALSHFNRVIGLKQGEVLIDAPSDKLTSSDLAELYRA